MIHVVCAIIEKEGKFLAALRSENMSQPNQWEFPGGKVENEEDHRSAIKREILEELNIEIEVLKQLNPNVHRYKDLEIKLFPFVCKFLSGSIELLEHKAIVWTNTESSFMLSWAEADVPILEEYLKIQK